MVKFLAFTSYVSYAQHARFLGRGIMLLGTGIVGDFHKKSLLEGKVCLPERMGLTAPSLTTQVSRQGQHVPRGEGTDRRRWGHFTDTCNKSGHSQCWVERTSLLSGQPQPCTWDTLSELHFIPQVIRTKWEEESSGEPVFSSKLKILEKQIHGRPFNRSLNCLW